MDVVAKQACEGCTKLAAEVAELRRQLAEIQDQLAKSRKNSATSSKPPSSDITNPPPKRKKPGRPKKRKIGGQPGHKRHERKPFLDEQVDFILEHRFDGCPCCGGTLIDAGTQPKTHQAFELVEKPIEVTEHHRVGQTCQDCGKTHHCPLPEDIRRAGLVGPKMTALIGWLKGVCHMSIGKIKKYCRDVVSVDLSARREEFASEETFRRSLERIRDDIVWDATVEQPDTQHAANMAERFYGHFEDYFRFITDPKIGPTNNLAEQAIRFVAIHRRMTQGTRGETGQGWFERICTVVVTCEQQSRSVLDLLVDAVESFFGEQPSPSPLPPTCDSS